MKVKSSYPKPKFPAIQTPETDSHSIKHGCEVFSNHQLEKKIHKKPVRKRVQNQTNSANQERLINMAEARREIIAALKCHRDAMKLAGDKPRWPEKKPQESPPFPPATYHISPVPSLPCIQEIPNLELPTRTLGLNLNLDGFKFLDTAENNPSSSTSSSAPLQVAAGETSGEKQGTQIVDSKELEEMKSIGKQHAMEWEDIMNLVNYAWWFKFLNSMEIEDQRGDDLVTSMFDQVIEFPAWLNTNESFLHSCYEDCLSASSLPCMELEDIDGDWLA